MSTWKKKLIICSDEDYRIQKKNVSKIIGYKLTIETKEWIGYL